MNTISEILTILVVNAAALLCLIRITDADEVMSKRIWTGKNDDRHRPYFVFIETYLETQEKPTPCGGVLIDTDIVLSAARCFDPYENLIRVIVNVGNFNSKGGGKREIEAVSVEVYDKMKSYKEKPGSERPPDIARLKLASAAVDKKDVLHPCGPDFWGANVDEKYENLFYKDFLIVGMGEINLVGDKPDVLQSLKITVTDDHLKCGAETTSVLFDNEDRFCAVGSEELKKIQLTRKLKNLQSEKEAVSFAFSSGPCYGDEGGPVIDVFSPTPSTPCLVGVLNEGIREREYGLNTCQYGMLFTSIEHLENWVENKQFTEIFHKKKS